MRSVLATKSPLGTEYRTENPFCCGLRTSGKREVCLKKGEDDHGPLEHQRTSRLSDGPFCRRSARKHHANNGHHLQDILFMTMWFKISHVVVSESKNKVLYLEFFLLFTLKFREVILPHPVQTRQRFGARLAWASVKETARLGVSRAAVFKVMTIYTNHGKTSSTDTKSGRKPQLSERDRRKMTWIVSKIRRITAANVAAELSIHLEGPVSTKIARWQLHRYNIHGGVAIAKPVITQNNAKSEKDGVIIIKPGRLMNVNRQ